MSVMAEVSLPAQLLRNAVEAPTQVAVRKRQLGLWKEYTWQDLARRTAAMAAGLRALGVQPGSRVAMASANRPAAWMADLAVQGIGAATVAVEPWITTAELTGALARLECPVLIAEDEEQLDKALEGRAATPCLRHIVVIDVAGYTLAGDGVGSLADLEASGTGDDVVDVFDRSVRALRTDDAATIVIAGGIDAPVVVSHVDALKMASEAADHVDLRESDELLSYVPFAEAAERALSIGGGVTRRAVVNFGAGPATLVADLRAVQPTVFHARAGVWELMAHQVASRIDDASSTKRRLYHAARAAGARRPGSKLWWLLVDRSLKAKLGASRLRVAVSDGGELSEATLGFYASLGIPIVGLPDREVAPR